MGFKFKTVLCAFLIGTSFFASAAGTTSKTTSKATTKTTTTKSTDKTTAKNKKDSKNTKEELPPPLPFEEEALSTEETVIEEQIPDIDDDTPSATVATDGSSPDAASSTDTYAMEQELAAGIEEAAGNIQNEGMTETEFVSQEEESEKNGIKRKEIGLAGVDHELTEKYRNQYLGAHGRKLLIESLKNSVPYRPYIIQQLTEKGLPLYLQYLPIVESNYVPTAVSRSGATGIWQFMENSMKPLLKKSTWFDDRRDGWKSTDMAILKLTENYKTFGDWALALAAYNCGAGAMSRILRENPGKDFWYLAENGILNQQSSQYVPRLLAIADIIENAEYYGATDIKEANELIKDLPVEEFDYISTSAMISFGQLAEASGVKKDTIKQLNLALFRNCTPAGEVYKVRLPKGTAEGVEEKLKKMGVAKDAIIHTVEKGDSLWGISRKYGVTVKDLCDANSISENGILSIGKKLIVPIFK
ncbi:MAG: transglycosylase SLT domain-containing protein [Treponema sp.]|nr:transglycosylase SLT domain-containing protein [Treponema sp.]